MASPQRQSRLYTVKENCETNIKMLKAEIDLMVDHPMIIPGNGHSLFHEIEDKLEEMHSYLGMLTVLERYFES